jgi:hypothetical protein
MLHASQIRGIPRYSTENLMEMLNFTDEEIHLTNAIKNAKNNVLLKSDKIYWNATEETISWNSIMPIVLDDTGTLYEIPKTKDHKVTCKIHHNGTSNIVSFTNGIPIPNDYGLYFTKRKRVKYAVSKSYGIIGKLLCNDHVTIYTAENSIENKKENTVSMFNIKTSNSSITIHNGKSYHGRLPYIVCLPTTIEIDSNTVPIYLYSEEIPFRKERQTTAEFVGLDIREHRKGHTETFSNVSPENIRVDIEMIIEQINELHDQKENIIIKKNLAIKHKLTHKVDKFSNIIANISLKIDQMNNEKTELLSLYKEMEDSDSSIEETVDEDGMNSVSSNSSDLSDESDEDFDLSDSSDSSEESNIKLSWKIGTTLPNKKIAIAHIITVHKDSFDANIKEILNKLLQNIGAKKIPLLSSIEFIELNNTKFDLISNKFATSVPNNKKIIAINLSGKVKFVPLDIFFDSNKSNEYDSTNKTYKIRNEINK